jgi:tetratricopeptide (TPR) repeat protein
MRLRVGVSIALLLLCLQVTAFAQSGAGKPWTEGVSPVAKSTALALFQQGNELYAKSEYRQASEVYRQALSHWRHPSIQGNLATCLIHLERPLEALAELEQALRFGAEPFEKHIYDQLLLNQKLLLQQTAEVQFAGELAGAEITFDGETVEKPERWRRVLVGRHPVVAKKRGYLPFTANVDTLPGTQTTIRPQWTSIDQAITYERRWNVWGPWATLGAGALVTAAGIPLQQAAHDNRDKYENRFAELCPTGCDRSTLPTDVQKLDDRRRLQNGLAISAYVLGSATMATGAVLIYLNRPIATERKQPAPSLVLLPSFDHPGVSITMPF